MASMSWSAGLSIDVIVPARRIALVALGASVVLAFPLVRAFDAFAGFAFFVVAALATFVLHLVPRWRRVGPGLGTLSLDGDDVVVLLDGERGKRPVERRFALRSIVSGYRTDDGVRLRTRRGEVVSVAFQRPEEGEAILRALGHDAHQRVLEVPLASIASRVPLLTTFVWVILLFLTPGTLTAPLALYFTLTSIVTNPTEMIFIACWTLFQVAAVALCVRMLQRRTVTVGTDGISFRRFLRKRFYPYAAVARVEPGPSGVSIALRSGRGLRLRTRAGWQKGGLDHHTHALLERIEIAQRAASSAADMHAKIQLLERRGRPLSAWREHLTALVGKAGYRSGAVTPAELSAVIADSTLPAEHRVAAALALSAAEPAEARARVRIAASASADHDLRAALEHAAEGEIDEARLDRLRAR